MNPDRLYQIIVRVYLPRPHWMRVMGDMFTHKGAYFRGRRDLRVAVDDLRVRHDLNDIHVRCVSRHEEEALGPLHPRRAT